MGGGGGTFMKFGTPTGLCERNWNIQNIKSVTSGCCEVMKFCDPEAVQILKISVADPDPPDPHVFGPPGCGSGSTSQRYGFGSESGSFYHHAKIVRKTLIPILWLFLTFYRRVCYYKTRHKISFYSLKCASRIVRNLSNRTGQKSAKFAGERKSGKYI